MIYIYYIMPLEGVISIKYSIIAKDVYCLLSLSKDALFCTPPPHTHNPGNFENAYIYNINIIYIYCIMPPEGVISFIHSIIATPPRPRSLPLAVPEYEYTKKPCPWTGFYWQSHFRVPIRLLVCFCALSIVCYKRNICIYYLLF